MNESDKDSLKSGQGERGPSREKSAAKKNRILKLTAVLLAAVLVFTYVIYQIVVISKSDIQTQIALTETVYKTFDTKCFVLRDEEFIENSSKGTTVSFARNGERVACGDTVSRVFSKTEDADTYLKISELEKDIAHYEKLDSQASMQAVDISSLDFKIREELTDFLNAVDKNNFSDAFENAELFGNSVTGKQIATGALLDYSEKLASLRTELETLKSIQLEYDEIKSDRAGYFISGSDGYENTLEYEKIDTYTAKDIERAISASPDKKNADAAGRTVGRFKWFILTVVDSDDTVDLKNGQTVYVNFPYDGVARLETKVYKIGDRNGDRTELILSCENMDEPLTDLRIEDIQLITNEYTGLKIKNSALRTVDGDVGVYVLSGNLIGFRKVHILFSTSEYTIVDNPDEKNGYLRLYDKVVTKGVELYDNKLVRG